MEEGWVFYKVECCATVGKSKIGVSSKYAVGHKFKGQHKNKTILQYSLEIKVISAYYQISTEVYIVKCSPPFSYHLSASNRAK